jgi:hypothetical protein
VLSKCELHPVTPPVALMENWTMISPQIRDRLVSG